MGLYITLVVVVFALTIREAYCWGKCAGAIEAFSEMEEINREIHMEVMKEYNLRRVK